MRWPGTVRTPGARLTKSVIRLPMSWGSTICPETFGSGAATGMEGTPVLRRLTLTTTVVPSGWVVAAAGAAMRRARG